MATLEISSDIAFEILSRSDIESLDLCKSVCKEWNEIPFESSFTQTHSERTGTISGYFVQHYNSCQTSHEFIATNESAIEKNCLGFLPMKLRMNTKVVASTKHGILCCKRTEHRRERYFICKPFTQQWVMLPNPKMRYFTIKIGIAVVGSNPLRYKIIRVSEPKHTQYGGSMMHNYICEIFDSKTWRWMRLKDIWLSYPTFIDTFNLVVVGGSIYMLLSDGNVLEFNTYTKDHTTFPLPQLQMLESLQHATKQLVEYKGKLGVVYQQRDGNVLRWILQDYKKHVWLKVETLSLEGVIKEEMFAQCIGFWNADIIVMANSSNISFCNFQKGTFEKFEFRHNNVSLQYVFPFRSDLKPTQLIHHYPTDLLAVGMNQADHSY